MKPLTFFCSGNVRISIPRVGLLKTALQEQNICHKLFFNKRRMAHLASYNHFTKYENQYKNSSISQLYQSPRTPILQKTYHRLLLQWLVSVNRASQHRQAHAVTIFSVYVSPFKKKTVALSWLEHFGVFIIFSQLSE